MENGYQLNCDCFVNNLPFSTLAFRTVSFWTFCRPLWCGRYEFIFIYLGEYLESSFDLRSHSFNSGKFSADMSSHVFSSAFPPFLSSGTLIRGGQPSSCICHISFVCPMGKERDSVSHSLPSLCEKWNGKSEGFFLIYLQRVISFKSPLHHLCLPFSNLGRETIGETFMNFSSSPLFCIRSPIKDTCKILVFSVFFPWPPLSRIIPKVVSLCLGAALYFWPIWTYFFHVSVGKVEKQMPLGPTTHLSSNSCEYCSAHQQLLRVGVQWLGFVGSLAQCPGVWKLWRETGAYYNWT